LAQRASLILEILNEGPKSPSQFVEEGLVPKEHYSTYQQALSLAFYHFRELEKDGCLEVLVARADGAMRAGTFDSRTDRHLAWMPMQLDQQGWDDLTAALASCFGEVEQIRHDSKERLAVSGEESISTTFGMLGFESPPPPPLPKADHQTD
jgi:hypothetical protein